MAAARHCRGRGSRGRRVGRRPSHPPPRTTGDKPKSADKPRAKTRTAPAPTAPRRVHRGGEAVDHRADDFHDSDADDFDADDFGPVEPGYGHLNPAPNYNSGGDSGGDNFWSRGDASGNSDGKPGYVCVEGRCSPYGM